MWAALLALTVLSGCVSQREVGQLPSPEPVDAGVDQQALNALRQGIVGRWCGSAEWSPESTFTPAPPAQLEWTFEADGSYRVECGCARPFPGEFTPDGVEGRYRINEITFDGLGWGRSEDVFPDGSTQSMLLQRIRIDGDRLRLERRRGLGVVGVWLDLRRCGS